MLLMVASFSESMAPKGNGIHEGSIGSDWEDLDGRESRRVLLGSGSLINTDWGPWEGGMGGGMWWGFGTQRRRSQTLTNGIGAGSWSLGSSSQGTACWGFFFSGAVRFLFSSLSLSKEKGRSEWWLEVKETGGGRVEYKRASRRRVLGGSKTRAGRYGPWRATGVGRGAGAV